MKHIILIPLYNDWESLNKLLKQIDDCLNEYDVSSNEIVIINDCSNIKENIFKNNLNNLKNIKIINLNKNLGSQKAIAIGLFHLSSNKEKNYFVTIMDSDGEDNPKEISRMLDAAKLNNDSIITSNRKKREESFVIKFMYKIHLILTFIFSTNWVSFGNFSTFHCKNLSKILEKNDSWYAHSSSILQKCKIKRLYAKREKRYFGKSKLNLLMLIEHSLRVNVVFLKKALISSTLYIFALIIFGINLFTSIIIFLILFFIFSLFFIRKKHLIADLKNLNEYISNIKTI